MFLMSTNYLTVNCHLANFCWSLYFVIILWLCLKSPVDFDCHLILAISTHLFKNRIAYRVQRITTDNPGNWNWEKSQLAWLQFFFGQFLIALHVCPEISSIPYIMLLTDLFQFVISNATWKATSYGVPPLNRSISLVQFRHYHQQETSLQHQMVMFKMTR